MSEAEPIVEATPEPTSEPTSEPAPAAEPTPTGFDWGQLRGSLPPEVRDNTILDGFSESGLPGLVSEHINLQRLVGGEKVTKPNEKSPPEDWDRFYSSLGRPETPGDYDLGDFAVPEGLPWDGDLQTRMLAEFHSAGLSTKQANEVMRSYLTVQSESFSNAQQQMEQQADDNERALREEWGTEYEGKTELARRAFKATFGDQLDEIAGVMVDGVQLGNHPVFVKAFQELGARMSEEGFAGSPQAAGFGQSPEQARQQIAEMESNRETQKALIDKGHPEHFALKRKHAALYAAAYPEER